jgi:2,3-bisphosphoglycerate-independent phosphoglycerate mutase
MKVCPTFLIIIDGFGINPNQKGNSVALANKPFIDTLLTDYSKTTLTTFGKMVGLPEGQMGNSEVGHLNIGAGRVIKQSLVRISDELNPEYLHSSTEYKGFINSKNNPIHLVGLVSDGGVHSHIDHLYKLIELLSNDTSSNIFLHLITDGRDTQPQSALSYIKELEKFIIKFTKVTIATISGRYYAMDRDTRWERTAKATDIMLGKKLLTTAATSEEYINQQYSLGLTDEFIEPIIIDSTGIISENDRIIFWNYRADRMRQLIATLPKATNQILTFTEYNKELPFPVLFSSSDIKNYLGFVVANYGLKQLRAAETEKYPHVTYFLNGGNEIELAGEDRILVASPRDITTYDKKPEMSAFELTDKVIETLSNTSYDLGVINYANCDMVGHTGVLEAAIKAVETVDLCLRKIVTYLKEQNWNILIIADHGNCEQMIDYLTGTPHTAHTTFPVPCILISPDKDNKLKDSKNSCLADIAPTILELMGLPQPTEMTGKSLLKKN